MPNAPAPHAPHATSDSETLPGLDELNLAEFPLAVLGERPEGVKALEFCDTVFDSSAGREVTRKLTVAGSELYGLPAHLDDDVLVVMMYLTNLNKFESRTIHFSRHQLVELLGWSDNGQSYERLTESLNRWVGVTLYYQNAWWDKKNKVWADRSFHLLSDLTLCDRKGRSRQSELPLSSFTWNEVVFDSFLVRNTKALDLNEYFGLKLAPAKRMYRFLDKRFGAKRGHVWRFDLREFACEHIGFARNYDSAQLKRKIKPSIAELEEYGFLKPMDDAERYPKGRRRGEHFIVVEKAATQENASPAPAEAKPEPAPLEAALIARKVTARVAQDLVAQHPAEDIASRIDILDWLLETKDKRVGRSPAGYLVKSIRDAFEPPAGYVSKTERDKTQQAVAERARKQQEQRKVAAERENRELEQHRAEREHIERYLAALTQPERDALEARAIDNADPTDRERIRDGFLAGVMRRLLIDRQVLREHPFLAKAG